MAFPLRFALVVGLAAAWGGAAEPRALLLPLLTGQLEGDFRPLTIEGAPTVHWQVALRPMPNGGRALEARIEGPGTRLVVEIESDLAGNGRWRVSGAEIDLATWSAAATAFLGEEFRESSASGTVSVEGEGTLREGVPDGRARLSIRDGRVDDKGHRVVIEGISLDFELVDIGRRRSAPRQSLTWERGNYETLSFGLGHVEFSLDGTKAHVSEASVEIFGGEVVVGSFDFSTERREASVIARIVGLDVSRMLPYLPAVLASARGRVDGSVTLHRTRAGLQIGTGNLALRSGETAELRLAPKPGLISTSLPDAVLKMYPGLGEIETGEVPLRADQLEIMFTPGGDSQGRSATIRVVGGPADPRLRAPVDLNINIRGPLEQLIKFGTDSRLKFGGKP